MSPIVIVPKKSGKLKICIDFRKLNVTTKKDPYPLQCIVTWRVIYKSSYYGFKSVENMALI